MVHFFYNLYPIGVESSAGVIFEQVDIFYLPDHIYVFLCPKTGKRTGPGDSYA